MISYLEGKIEFKGGKYVVVSAGGVGYRAFASPETLKKIPEKNGTVKLWIHTHLREDALELYGFLNFAELDLFETMILAPGIGPRKALGVLGVAPIDTLRRAIAAGDTSYLVRVSGIGRKTAEKIVLELREKMAGRGVVVDAPELKEEADAMEALVQLGYSQSEAREALRQVSREAVSPEQRVKEALKKIGSGK